jgi:hypothetical protein
MAAARLHGLWLPTEWADEPIDVILHGAQPEPRRRSGSVRAEVRGRRRRLSAAETVVRDGVPMTSCGRTWLDLAERLELADLVAAGDSILHHGLGTGAGLRAVVNEAGRPRGIVSARQAVDMLDGRSRSRPESHLRVILTDAGLPRPAVNCPIYDEHGQWLAEPDLNYGEARLSIEYNGGDHADVRQMRKDITRALDVLRARWLTLTFGPAQVFGRPDEVLSLVRTCLDARDPAWRQRMRSA